MFKRYILAALTVAVLMLGLALPVLAAQYDSPSVSVKAVGHSKITVTVTAGATGAPDGFAVCWMKYADFENYGDVWPADPNYPGFGWSYFTGTPTLNDFSSGADYRLAPFESMTIEIGDLGDENVTAFVSDAPGELDQSTEYMVCAFAKAGSGWSQSGFSSTLSSSTSAQGENCTFTVGYWKNHPEAWPVGTLTLGSVAYTQAELLSILNEPVGGNGLISLAHQLIATKLNLANGAIPTALVTSTIAAADAQIGALVVPPVGSGYLSPGSTSGKTNILDDYNQGITGPGHCSETPAHTSTWGHLKAQYR